jgi:hypothetical protein
LPSARTISRTDATVAVFRTLLLLDAHMVALSLQAMIVTTTIQRSSTTTLPIQLMDQVLTFTLTQLAQTTRNVIKVATSLPIRTKSKA